jgi:hypothetical protein
VPRQEIRMGRKSPRMASRQLRVVASFEVGALPTETRAMLDWEIYPGS